MTAARGKVRILTEVKNDTGIVRKVTVRHTVREEQSGCVVLRGEKDAELGAGEDSRVQADLPPLASPRLWSPAAPNMYRVTTELLDEKGKVLDRVENPLGFRTLELTADRVHFSGSKDSAPQKPAQTFEEISEDDGDLPF